MKTEEAFLGKRLDNIVKEAFFDEYFSITGDELTRNIVQKALETGKIKVNGEVKKASYKIKSGDDIDFNIEKKKEAILLPNNIPLDIFYEDEYLIVLNKRKNILCHPTGKNENNTLVNALLYHTEGKLSDIGGAFRQGIVHRLDKNTSGLMLIAKTNEAHSFLQKDIQDKKTIRKYLTICHGTVEKDNGTIDKPLVHYLKNTVKMSVAKEGLRAVTHYKVLERFQNATFLEIQLETGRTHQIRCHLSSIGHPVAGDELYGAKAFQNGIFKGLKTTGQVLESYYIKFVHPITKKEMEFEIKDHHEDLVKTLKLLRN